MICHRNASCEAAEATGEQLFVFHRVGKNSRLVSAAQAELLTGSEGVSSRPVRRIASIAPCEQINTGLIAAVAASPAVSRSNRSLLSGGRKEATVILTLLVAVSAVLLAVLGQALLAPNDNIRL
jgi:hypothetical protein